MRSVAGPGRGVRAPRLSGASRASTEGARARAATSRESCRLVRLSAERQREPSRACHGEGHRQRGEIGAALDSSGVRGAARVYGPVRNWRGPTRRLESEQDHVDKAKPKRRGVGRESEGGGVPAKGRRTAWREGPLLWLCVRMGVSARARAEASTTRGAKVENSNGCHCERPNRSAESAGQAL